MVSDFTASATAQSDPDCIYACMHRFVYTRAGMAIHCNPLRVLGMVLGSLHDLERMRIMLLILPLSFSLSSDAGWR